MMSRSFPPSSDGILYIHLGNQSTLYHLQGIHAGLFGNLIVFKMTLTQQGKGEVPNYYGLRTVQIRIGEGNPEANLVARPRMDKMRETTVINQGFHYTNKEFIDVHFLDIQHTGRVQSKAQSEKKCLCTHSKSFHFSN